MRKLTVTRKKQFRSSAVSYWIVLSDISKEQFSEKYCLNGDLCDHNGIGQAVSRLDTNILNQIGVPISNGETVCVDLADDTISVFAITLTGSLSNEIKVQEMKSSNLVVSTAGGWKTVCYPLLKEQES